MGTETIDLRPLWSINGLSEVEGKFIGVFESAFASLPQQGLAENATQAAADIRELGSHVRRGQEADDLRDSFWQTVINVAKRVPFRHDGQTLLVEILRTLHGGGEAVADYDILQEDIWQGLPAFGRCVRDSWDDPTYYGAPGDALDDLVASEWLNLNSFAARMYQAGLVVWVNFAVWQLRHGLEEEVSRGSMTDCRVSVAGEWILISGRRLLQESRARVDLSEADARSYRAGALYSGPPGLCAERWAFWQERLQELRGIVSESAARIVGEALEVMDSE